MRHPALLPAVVLIPALLACGGLGASVKPGEHLQQVCEAGGKVSVLHEPPKTDLPYAPLEPGRHVTVDSSFDTLDTSVGEARILLEIAQDTPASRIVEVLRAARAGGARTVDLIVASNEPVQLPPYPDPDYAADFEHRLRGLDAAQRAMVAAAEIEGQIALCPPAQEVFAAIAHASPDARCELFAYGLQEALPVCLATDSDKVVTAVQVLSQPSGAWRPTALTLKLTDDGEPLEVPAGAGWKDLAPLWAAHHGQEIALP